MINKLKKAAPFLAFSLAILFFLGGVNIVLAENNGKTTPPRVAGAVDFIRDTGNKAIATFSDPGESDEVTEAEFRDLLTTAFDIPTISKFTMGRYWRVASPDQRKEYQQLLEDVIVDLYLNRLRGYGGGGFEIVSSRPVGDRDTMVKTEFSSDGQGGPVQLTWRVRKFGSGDYRIIDVLVEGISMSVTNRADFASVIERNGGRVEALLNALRDKSFVNQLKENNPA
jgi:phospholipid transport system substrate-binding protein